MTSCGAWIEINELHIPQRHSVACSGGFIALPARTVAFSVIYPPIFGAKWDYQLLGQFRNWYLLQSRNGAWSATDLVAASA